MIDPITISLVVGGAKALKSAFETAKEAMDEFRECAAAGKDAQESFGSLIQVFTANGEVHKQIAEARKAKDEPAPVTEDGSPAQPAPRKSATAMALEAMQYERELKAQEEELKNYLIYQCSEPGLYEELCRRRNAIINAEQEDLEAARIAEVERLLDIKRAEMAKRRIRMRQIQIMQDVASVAVGALACAALIYFIWWMFQQG